MRSPGVKGNWASASLCAAVIRAQVPEPEPANTAPFHRSRLICRFTRNSTYLLFKDCEHVKPLSDLLFKILNARSALETLKLFIQFVNIRNHTK